MSSLFRNLNSAAIDAKLNKNELLIFNALMSQTLGFGKCSDPLTDKRLAELTGIRLDRLRPALKGFLKRDIFFRVEHKRYGYEYCIAEHFFDDRLNKKIYTPHYANNGEAEKNPSDLTTHGSEKPAKRGHTTTNLTEIQKKPPQPITENDLFTEKKIEIQKTPPPQKTETNLKKPPPQNQDQQNQQNQPEQTNHESSRVVDIFIGGLNQLPEQFVIQSSVGVRIEFSSQNISTNANATTSTSTQHDDTVPPAITEITPATQESSVPIIEPEPRIKPRDNSNHMNNSDKIDKIDNIIKPPPPSIMTET
jgi:phage replication O-like protein O